MNKTAKKIAREAKGVPALAARLERWLAARVKKAGAKGVAFGLSGGVDSAVIAGISKAALGDAHAAAVMHISNSDLDKKCTDELVPRLGLNAVHLDLKPAAEALARACGVNPRSDVSAYGNVKARVRAVALYALAQKRGYLVCGTSNRDEWLTGYFTKYGDAACDLAPLRNLLKREVYALAKHYGVPASVIERAPSASLAPGQTDEADLGFSYAALDAFLGDGKPLPPASLKRLRQLYAASAHKRGLPPAPAGTAKPKRP